MLGGFKKILLELKNGGTFIHHEDDREIAIRINQKMDEFNCLVCKAKKMGLDVHIESGYGTSDGKPFNVVVTKIINKQYRGGQAATP